MVVILLLFKYKIFFGLFVCHSWGRNSYIIQLTNGTAGGLKRPHSIQCLKTLCFCNYFFSDQSFLQRFLEAVILLLEIERHFAVESVSDSPEFLFHVILTWTTDAFSFNICKTIKLHEIITAGLIQRWWIHVAETVVIYVICQLLFTSHVPREWRRWLHRFSGVSTVNVWFSLPVDCRWKPYRRISEAEDHRYSKAREYTHMNGSSSK